MVGILHQVNHPLDEDIIFAMHTGDTYEWRWSSRNDPVLPFLWKVSKKELLELLED